MPVAIKGVKQKTCKACGTKFKPHLSTQKACSIRCALDLAPANLDRARKAIEHRDKATTKARRERLKSKADYMREAQVAFNAYIRARDADLPCVSCGRHHEGQYHAGHYRTVGANPEIRFEPLNVWKQCAPCNNHKSGDIVNYRIELVKRIGAEKVEWLEGPHEPKRYTIEDLQAIKVEYREKLKALIRASQG